MLVRSGAPASGLWAPDATLKAILDAVPTALAVLDRHGNLVHCNAAWTALGARTAPYGELGSLVTGTDHVGTAYLRRLAGLEGPLALPARRLARAAQDALAGRPHDARLAYRVRRPEGEEPFEAVLTPLPAGSLQLLLLQHVDAGDRERAAEAEAHALEIGLETERLRSSERRLKRQITAAARDLHTPVTPVRLELHLLQSGACGPLTDRQAKALDLIARNVQRWAVGEEAFLALLAAPVPTGETIDVGRVALAAVEDCQTRALQEGVRLLPPSTLQPLPVRAPAATVRDALDRFLDHALEASSAGGTVAIEAQARDGRAVVAVVDSGSGLSARDVRAVFEPWGGRRDGPRDLSLHYARVEMEQAGGTVWAESDGAGQGLLLGFSLPLAEPDEAA